MRILIDTNVYISALVFGGIPLKAVQLARAHGQLIAFGYIVQELRAVLASAKFGWPKARIDSACTMLLADVLMVEDGSVIQVARDAKDDPILACALAANAEAIITGDKDLLVLKQYRGILIITPAAFVRQLQP